MPTQQAYCKLEVNWNLQFAIIMNQNSWQLTVRKVAGLANSDDGTQE